MLALPGRFGEYTHVTHEGYSPFLQGQPHEAFPLLQRDRIPAGSALKGLGGSADDDDYGVSRPVLGQQVVDGVLVDGTDTCKRHKGEGAERERGFLFIRNPLQQR